MVLTPADIQNVAFDKVSLGGSGYNGDQVDTFIDLVTEQVIARDEQISNLNGQIEQLKYELQLAEQKNADSSSRSNNEETYFRTAKILELAQETADKTILAAQKEADEIKVQVDQDRNDILSSANNEATKIISEARELAAELRADAESKHSEILEDISQKRTFLEGRLDRLRVFEKEYHSRLRNHINSQLQELSQLQAEAEPFYSPEETEPDSQ